MSRLHLERLQRQLEAAYCTSRRHALKKVFGGLDPEEAAWITPHYKGFP